VRWSYKPYGIFEALSGEYTCNGTISDRLSSHELQLVTQSLANSRFQRKQAMANNRGISAFTGGPIGGHGP
jgi:hypothetical protein